MTPPTFLARHTRRLAERVRARKLQLSRARRGAIPPPVDAGGPSRHIVVIGAGLAGLCAAYLLRRNGQRVTVLEARQRAGGRILTLREGFADGLYADAGAARIADIHDRTMTWINHFRLKLEPMYPDAGRLIGECDGRAVPGADAATLSSNDVHRILMSLVPWEAQFSELRSVQTLVRNSLIKSSWYRIRGGMDLLPRAFVERLAGAIRYGVVVTALQDRADAMEVAYCDHGTEGSMRGDFVVCTVPYTTLRSIRVSPRFPDDKLGIIHECRYESATRVVLQLQDRTWLKKGWSGYGVTQDKLEIWHPSFSTDTKRSLLVLYAQGEAAQSFTTIAPEARIETAIRRLDRLFPGIRGRCEATVQFCWDEEPWSYGAQHIGELPLDVATRPEGRLHFAGAHTSETGWMDGALESGERVAAEILARVSATSSSRPSPARGKFRRPSA